MMVSINDLKLAFRPSDCDSVRHSEPLSHGSVIHANKYFYISSSANKLIKDKLLVSIEYCTAVISLHVLS